MTNDLCTGAALAQAMRWALQDRRNTHARLCRLIGELVAAALGVTASDLRSRSRGRASVVFARQAAMYVGHVVFGLSLMRLARGFGRDRTTARHACRLIEERRDDPAVDEFFGLLEAICCEAASECARTRGGSHDLRRPPSHCAASRSSAAGGGRPDACATPCARTWTHKSGARISRCLSPLCSRKRRESVHRLMSALCQKTTSAVSTCILALKLLRRQAW